jgi:DNA mismatch endonuclease (patch repair protein)
MKATRQRDTAAEIAIQQALVQAGVEFDVDVPIIPSTRRRADIVIREQRLVVFVDGCFWHGCPVHGTWPKQNADWWREKLERNRERDADTDQRLLTAGWNVLRIWEHETPSEAVAKILGHVRAL